MKKDPYKKPQRDLLGRQEVVTFSQTNEMYDRSKFTPEKCLDPNRIRRRK